MRDDDGQRTTRQGRASVTLVFEAELRTRDTPCKFLNFEAEIQVQVHVHVSMHVQCTGTSFFPLI